MGSKRSSTFRKTLRILPNFANKVSKSVASAIPKFKLPSLIKSSTKRKSNKNSRKSRKSRNSRKSRKSKK